MALLLSFISLLCAILYPCSSMKYIGHSILAITLYTPISFPSVDLFPFIFCFLGNIYSATLPRDIISPMCPRNYSCTAYEASTHHFTTDISPTLKVSFNYLVHLIYFNTQFSFPQLSSSVFLRTWRRIPLVSVCLNLPWNS